MVDLYRLTSVRDKLSQRGLTSLANRLEELAVQAGINSEVEVTARGRNQRQLWRRLKRKLHRPKRKKFSCCTRPKLKRTWKGRRVWISHCRYTIGKIRRQMPRIVSYAAKKPTNQLTVLEGRRQRKVPWC